MAFGELRGTTETYGFIQERLPSDERIFPISWYAVGWSHELKRQPIKKRLVGQDFVLYRDTKGRVRAVSAYCAHRGADLALGKCSDTIQCAYHGWEFDETGRCTRIPAHPDRPIPDFARIQAFPTQEQAGLIWVYPQSLDSLALKNRKSATRDSASSGMASGRLHNQPSENASCDVPPLVLFPELTDPAFRLSPYDEHWRAHLTRVVESVLDVAHLAFVHKKTIGKRVPAEVKELKFEVPNPDVIRIKNGGGLLDYQFPQHWILRPSSAREQNKAQFINYVTFTPVDSFETHIYGYAGRTFARGVPFLDAVFSRYSRRVLKEDQALVESQHPRPIPEALRMEAHVPADAPQVRFRQRWFEFLSSDEPKVVLGERISP